MIVREFEEDFILRVYKTSAVITTVAVLASLALRQFTVGAGILAGTVVGIATLWSLEWVVRRTFTPGVTDGRRAFMRYAFLKYPLLALVLIPVIFTESFVFILAFLGGLLITHVVIFSRAVGGIVSRRTN